MIFSEIFNDDCEKGCLCTSVVLCDVCQKFVEHFFESDRCCNVSSHAYFPKMSGRISSRGMPYIDCINFAFLTDGFLTSASQSDITDSARPSSKAISF